MQTRSKLLDYDPDYPRERDREMFLRDWCWRVPELRLDPGWKIQPRPATMGALLRFQVNNRISVYLDVEGNLGHYGYPDDEPYWEIYPDADGDNARFALNDIDGLYESLKAAVEALGMTGHERMAMWRPVPRAAAA